MSRHLILIIISFLIHSFLFAEEETHADRVAGPFSTPREVTETCLMCHEDAAKEIMQTSHWTWLSQEKMHIAGHRANQRIGKKNVFNNFCINLNSNWPRCTSCHIGYGWRDNNFDFEDETNVDCLSCHDNTGTYKKIPTGAGMPDPTINLEYIAQNVGPTSRKTCGSCHFYGGGGANVKHGELEPALINPHPGADVHMGLNEMNCTQCHETEAHQIKGVALSVNADTRNREVECTNCHGDAPHEIKFLNTHYQRIACQTCHIPLYAKNLPTKTYWDWSTAGQDLVVEKDADGFPNYSKKKGSFEWGKDIQPEYFWFNGTTGRYLLGDKLKMNRVNHLNPPQGSKKDKSAKIYPFKVHRGKQIADQKYKYLIVPKLFGGFWMHFDWQKAAEDGMKSVDLAYSGKYTFVATDMHWRLNHEVVPAGGALSCTDCHSPDSRMNWTALGYKKDPAPKKFMENYLGKMQSQKEEE